MRNLAVLCVAFVYGATGQSDGANTICEGDHPKLASVSIGMSLREVERVLGRGKLTIRSPDADAERQYYYIWERSRRRIEVIFTSGKEAVFVGFSSRTKIAPLGALTLNGSTLVDVVRLLGEPAERVGPAYGEGNYTFYSLVYNCGSKVQVEFMTDMDCRRPDMNACLSESLLRSRTIHRVALKKRAAD